MKKVILTSSLDDLYWKTRGNVGYRVLTDRTYWAIRESVCSIREMTIAPMNQGSA